VGIPPRRSPVFLSRAVAPPLSPAFHAHGSTAGNLTRPTRFYDAAPVLSLASSVVPVRSSGLAFKSSDPQCFFLIFPPIFDPMVVELALRSRPEVVLSHPVKDPSLAAFPPRFPRLQDASSAFLLSFNQMLRSKFVPRKKFRFPRFFNTPGPCGPLLKGRSQHETADIPTPERNIVHSSFV